MGGVLQERGRWQMEAVEPGNRYNAATPMARWSVPTNHTKPHTATRVYLLVWVQERILEAK
jgi:hypothetical protein